MASISFRNVNKIYDNEVKAVSDFTFEVEDGEFIVLVGPSGCGKSTTLRMVAGLEAISSGEIYIDGQLINNVPPKDRDIAMVFQNYALYPHMTVYDNMAFGLKLRKEKKSFIDARVREAAEILDITDLLKRKPKALSGGQRQRVAIGRAIVRHPKVFLMDEPLSNLDAKLRSQMRAEIIKLRHKLNTTFIYVTHDQTEAMTLGDKIVIMQDGFVRQAGTPKELFNHPANLFVASFIGTPQMNFFEARLERLADGYEISLNGSAIPLSESAKKTLAQRDTPAGPVTLGVRPDRMCVMPEGGLEAKVELTELMGNCINLHATVKGTPAIIIVPISDLDQDFPNFTPNMPINVGFPQDSIYLFSREDGTSLL